ncbi:MAG: riboflavin kinase [Desulfurococcales archaeon ex4484_58]|nr:MAG: riboflavin kinase [Desulfurococcales archaeon ex4484_58]
MNQLILIGRVVKGLGEGARYVSLYSSVFEKYLGFKPYPGTLNIDVGRDVSKEFSSIPAILIPPPYDGLGYVLAYEGLIDDLKVYVIKPVITRHKWNILEVISEYNLRQYLNLHDGSIVKITIYWD